MELLGLGHLRESAWKRPFSPEHSSKRSSGDRDAHCFPSLLFVSVPLSVLLFSLLSHCLSLSGFVLSLSLLVFPSLSSSLSSGGATGWPDQLREALTLLHGFSGLLLTLARVLLSRVGKCVLLREQ